MNEPGFKVFFKPFNEMHCYFTETFDNMIECCSIQG